MDLFAHRANDLPGVGMRLRSLLGDHPGTKALKAGGVSSPLVTFDFADVKAVFPEFKPMMRELKYDFGEIALNTYLQGFEYG
jgi:4,5-dihydroxyphthalate decarboxylase